MGCAESIPVNDSRPVNHGHLRVKHIALYPTAWEGQHPITVNSWGTCTIPSQIRFPPLKFSPPGVYTILPTNVIRYRTGGKWLPLMIVTPTFAKKNLSFVDSKYNSHSIVVTPCGSNVLITHEGIEELEDMENGANDVGQMQEI
jgi:hypothetical protein